MPTAKAVLVVFKNIRAYQLERILDYLSIPKTRCSCISIVYQIQDCVFQNCNNYNLSTR